MNPPPSASAPPSPASAPAAPVERGSSPGHDAWLRLRRNRLAVFGGITLMLVTLVCFLGPWFSPYGYEDIDLQQVFAPPGVRHWLGTDMLGRDLLVRILYGGRVSLAVGLSATVVALTIGVIYGAVAGFVGGKLDAVLMRIVDILYSLPFTIFVILLMAFFGRNILLLFAAIGAVEWLTMARIVRGQVMSSNGWSSLRRRTRSASADGASFSATSCPTCSVRSSFARP